jgi:hypothetical protein
MMGQQLLAAKQVRYPEREAETILIESCRLVGERFAIPLPDPRVELRQGEPVNTVESDNDTHVIRLQLGLVASLIPMRLVLARN